MNKPFNPYARKPKFKQRTSAANSASLIAEIRRASGRPETQPTSTPRTKRPKAAPITGRKGRANAGFDETANSAIDKRIGI